MTIIIEAVTSQKVTEVKKEKVKVVAKTKGNTCLIWYRSYNNIIEAATTKKATEVKKEEVKVVAKGNTCLIWYRSHNNRWRFICRCEEWSAL